jgi:Ribbon-helix-helix protein, copG family
MFGSNSGFSLRRAASGGIVRTAWPPVKYFLEKIMSTRKMVSFKLDAAVIELLKQLSRDRGQSQASLIREMILREVYK